MTAQKWGRVHKQEGAFIIMLQEVPRAQRRALTRALSDFARAHERNEAIAFDSFPQAGSSMKQNLRSTAEARDEEPME